jgi:two-component system, chemotaxis family, protein-glutamate methylesterase/glutaminase
MTASSESQRRRVLIVDDSELMRALLRELIGQAGFDVVGEAATGYQAIRLVHELDPDIVTMDLDMPDLGGVDAIGYIMSEVPRPVVVISSQSGVMADPALGALFEGAIEVVAKPEAGAGERNAFRDRLRQALHAAAIARLLRLPERAVLMRTARRADAVSGSGSVRGMPRLVAVIAASTGGPRAIAGILPQLPADLAGALLIVQHMPAAFTQAFARRLDNAADMPVVEAEAGASLREGHAYVAPGGLHLELERSMGGVRIRLTDAPPVWGVRPAADVTLASVARTCGPASAGVVLTGMGRDGEAGLRLVREVGGATVAQDEESAVVASMPRAAARHADRIVPLEGIAAELVRLASSRSRADSA